MRQLLASTDAAELAEYQALYSISPYGPAQENWRFAVLCSVLHNINSERRNHRGPEEFLKMFQKEAPPDGDTLALAAMKITAKLGGKIRGNNQ